MTYLKVTKPVVLINGYRGAYDRTDIHDDSVRYGRNAGHDACKYRKQIQMAATNITNFSYRYLPGLQLDKMALVGNAYEMLRENNESKNFNGSLKVKDIDAKYRQSGDRDLSVSALDINEDGKIDVKEMAIGLVVQDALSSDAPREIGLKYAKERYTDGEINQKGYNKMQEMLRKEDVEDSRETFREIAKDFDLDETVEQFFSDKNNLREATF